MPALSSHLQIPTKAITPDTLYLVGIVTLISGFQLAGFARKVGQARRKYKVIPPRTDGDEAFVRCFRAQQNCLEFYPIFLVVTWMSAVFFHQFPAAVLATYYLFERERYFQQYSKSTEGRVWPFYKSAGALRFLALLAAVGLFNVLVRQVFHWDLLQTIADAVVVPF